VLAVGDAQFQKKSVSKLKEISKAGQTVLFVSHNLSAIGALCNSGLYLQDGRLVRTGPIHEILAKYSQDGAAGRKYERAIPVMSDAAVASASAIYDAGTTIDLPRIFLKLGVVARRDMRISIGIQLKDALGMAIAYASLGGLRLWEVIPLKKGVNQLEIEIPAETLAAGSYTISIHLADPNVVYYDRAEDCLSIDVEPIAMLGTGSPLRQAWGFGSILLHPKIVYNKQLTTA
jgi:lipopolysaccharide transport system ATP-binding protein